MEWIKVKTRELTDEERESYPSSIGFIWDMLTPEWFIDVLLTDGNTVWVEEDSYIGFEDSHPDDYENLWYMPFPEPPKVEEEIERDNIHVCFNHNLVVNLDVYYLDKLVESVEILLLDLENYLTQLRNDNLDEIYAYVVKVRFIE